jgi:hypothetical protein
MKNNMENFKIEKKEKVKNEVDFSLEIIKALSEKDSEKKMDVLKKIEDFFDDEENSGKIIKIKIGYYGKESLRFLQAIKASYSEKIDISVECTIEEKNSFTEAFANGVE